MDRPPGRAQFLFCVYMSEQALAAVSREQMNEIVEQHIQYHREVLSTRHVVLDPRQIEPAARARTVRRRAAGAEAVDGPALSGSEALVGVYVVDCAGAADALEVAARYPMPEGLGCVEVRPVVDTWEFAPSADTVASPATVWDLYRDVATWPSWKVGIEHVELDGPLETGATGWLTPSGLEPVPFRVVHARRDEGYVSETVLAETVTLRMEHVLTPLPDGGTRIVHRASIPRSAVEVFGSEFSPRFNAGVEATVAALSEQARAWEGVPTGEEV